MSSRDEIASVKATLEAMSETLAGQLPPHIPLARFISAAMTAVQKNPDLLTKCDRASLYLACKDAAEDGLLPDGRESAIVPHKGKATFMPMVAGLVKLAWQCGQVAALHADAAYHGETFEVWGGTDARVVHQYKLDARGNGGSLDAVQAVYATAKLISGETMQAVLTPGEVAKIRAMSKAANGPWGPWPVEMAKVRAVRRLTKMLPLASDRDADMRMRRAAERGDAIDGIAEDVSDQPALGAPVSGDKLAQLEHAMGLGTLPEAAERAEVEHEPPPVQARQAQPRPAQSPVMDVVDQLRTGRTPPAPEPPPADVRWVNEQCLFLRTATLAKFNEWLTDPRCLDDRADLRENWPGLSDRLEAGVEMARRRLHADVDALETDIWGGPVT